jgi:O-methyltransferase involved in polyketide biosynthesis
VRAAHQVLDNPRVFDDPLALRIVDAQGNTEFHSEKRKYKIRLNRYFRAIAVARSRFVEDELSLSIKRGVRQYVILGAGLVTFAYRNPYSSIGL